MNELVDARAVLVDEYFDKYRAYFRGFRRLPQVVAIPPGIEANDGEWLKGLVPSTSTGQVV